MYALRGREVPRYAAQARTQRKCSQAFAYVYYSNESGRRSAAKLRDEARRIAIPTMTRKIWLFCVIKKERACVGIPTQVRRAGSFKPGQAGMTATISSVRGSTITISSSTRK
jgi:hypothetical protein